MKMTSDSAIKTQITTIAAQIKWLKSQEANASRNNLPQYVKFFQSERKQLVNTFNTLTGQTNSTSGLKTGPRVWLSNITSGKVKPYGRAFAILARSK